MEHQARIVIIVFLVISLTAADHLYYLRKPQEMLIKGVQVDADMHFRQLTVKVNPQGQQSVTLRAAATLRF